MRAKVTHSEMKKVNMLERYKGDPVFRLDGKYYFFDEVYMNTFGPYDTLKECDAMLEDYASTV